jgi:hypothetical protein
MDFLTQFYSREAFILLPEIRTFSGSVGSLFNN